MSNMPKFEVGDCVRTVRDLTDGDTLLVPADSEGTITVVLPAQGGYHVEFADNGTERQWIIPESLVYQLGDYRSPVAYGRDGTLYTITTETGKNGIDGIWRCECGVDGKVLDQSDEKSAIDAAIASLSGHHFHKHQKTLRADR